MKKPARFRCEMVSWSRVLRLSRSLAFMIRDSGYRPGLLVAIGRGGYVPARILSDYLTQNNLASFRIVHYRKGAERQEAAEIRYPLAADPSGLDVLVVDDVSDTGDTLELAVKHVNSLGPTRIRTAVLHHKEVSSFIPDYHAERLVRWRWIIYPWAVIEDLSGFIMKMEDRPGSPSGIAERLERDYGIKVADRTVEDVLRAIEN